MTDFLKKQRAFKLLRNISIIVSAVLICMYIGAEPYIEKGFGNTAPFQLALFVLVIISMALLFIYESRYAKAAEFIQDIGYEISDSGYYLTTREEKDAAEFTEAAVNDLKADGYRCESAISVNGLEFAASAVKGNEFIYFVSVDTADKNDIFIVANCAQVEPMLKATSGRIKPDHILSEPSARNTAFLKPKDVHFTSITESPLISDISVLYRVGDTTSQSFAP